MSKFLEIIEGATPGEIDMVKTLFNKNIVKSVVGLREKDIITLSLSDDTKVQLKILDVLEGEEEEDTLTDKPFLSDKERNIIKATADLGATATRRTFGMGDPVKNLGKAVGDFYNKLSTRLKNISAKMSV